MILPSLPSSSSDHELAHTGGIAEQKRDHVAVRLGGALGFDVWRTLRDGRELSLRSGLPLRVDVRHCAKANLAGIATLVMTVERLQTIEMRGCTEVLSHAFEKFDICERCSNQNTSRCPKMPA